MIWVEAGRGKLEVLLGYGEIVMLTLMKRNRAN
ncbi:hypothetical protein SAMN05444407_107192 [Chryseobacterium contaminans]|uniref:Uncharacterized protein n=1 Tax=Chryseobacterium contaminans TaxID=1423959 RepID=A0A1M7EIV8_9FLAO|nr:hypothetical protein SAMN05444407_107192 [Chryseobacterium contaminans]